MELEYRKIDRINQSTLKKLLTSPQAYLKARDRVEDSKAEHFVFGSMVDDMLLNPKVVGDKYYVMEEDSSSDAIKQIVRYVYDNAILDELQGDDLGAPQFDKYILRGCITYDYQNRYKDETKLKNIREKGFNYYESLKEAEGKIIVSKEDYNKATIASSSLKADDFTAEYFIPTQHNTIYKHKIILFELDGLVCKGELDMVYIDHQKKTIRPIDIKTTGKSVYGFEYDFWAYRYDFQAAFYEAGLVRDPEIGQLLSDGYDLLDFHYLVVEKDLVNPPLIFTVPDSVISIGYGGGRRSNGRYYEGVKHAIEKFKWHTEENLWDYPMDYYKNDGTLYIEI